MPSIREKEIKKVSEEIMELLTKQTVKEKSLCEKFRSKGGKYKYYNNTYYNLPIIMYIFFYKKGHMLWNFVHMVLDQIAWRGMFVKSFISKKLSKCILMKL